MHFAKEKDFLMKILLHVKNAFRPIFHNVPYTVPYTSPTRPLHVPYVPHKFPQRGGFCCLGLKQRAERDGRARLCN